MTSEPKEVPPFEDDRNYMRKFEAHETLPPDDEDGIQEYEEWMQYFEELENREKRRGWY